jgi:hypothetical protein
MAARKRTAAAAAVGVAVVAAVGVLAVVAHRSDGFEERPVAAAALPSLIRAEVAAHGGGRCVEQRPSVYRCVLRRPKQAHESGGGTEWCFDSDGPETMSAYPAPARGAHCED